MLMKRRLAIPDWRARADRAPKSLHRTELAAQLRKSGPCPVAGSASQRGGAAPPVVLAPPDAARARRIAELRAKSRACATAWANSGA
jgi:hypothetical protein